MSDEEKRRARGEIGAKLFLNGFKVSGLAVVLWIVELAIAILAMSAGRFHADDMLFSPVVAAIWITPMVIGQLMIAMGFGLLIARLGRLVSLSFTLGITCILGYLGLSPFVKRYPGLSVLVNRLSSVGSVSWIAFIVILTVTMWRFKAAPEQEQPHDSPESRV